MSGFSGWRAFRILLAVVAVVGLLTLLVVRRPETIAPAAAGSNAVAVVTAPVTRGPLRSVITATAGIEASQQVMVAPRVAGPLAAIHVEVGANVKAGDALATLDPGTLGAQVQQARAAVLSANARFGLVQEGATSADMAGASGALLSAVNQESVAQTALDALQGRANTATAATAAQVENDRMRSQRTTAQATIDSTISQLTTNASGVRSAITQLDSVVSARCTQLANREQCAVIATGSAASGGLAALVKALNTGTPAVPTDFTAALSQYEAAASSITTAGFQEAVASFVQAGAALPGLGARATNSTLSLGGPAGSPTAETLANAIRARDAASAAVAAARERLEKMQSGPENADLLGARAAQASALAGLAVAEASLEQTIVRAPFDGVVADRLLDVGAAASPATPVFNLVTRAIELRLAVDEARVAQVRPGQAAELTVSAYPGRTFAGKVSVVAPLGDPRTHTFDVRVLADDAEGQLRPGMLAEVHLVTEEQAGVLLVPNGAIVTQGQGAVVFTVRDNKATLRRVRLGATDGKVTAILEGVAVGDQVVVGQGALRDGQAVNVRTAPATPTPAPSATPAKAQ